MLHRRKSLGAAFVAVATAGTLVLSYSPAQADFAPQPEDVVTTGSDILQNSFNFLADGYHQFPGYNTAGNRYRFANFDSSGDAQGRSGFIDPRLLPTVTGNGTVGEAGTKYVKVNDVKLLNPTIALRAGQDLVVRPSGGSGGGTTAIINDKQKWIDGGRTPTAPLSTAQQDAAFANYGSRLLEVQIATDRQLLATAATSNAPATISAGDLLKIYSGEYTTWGQLPGYSGSAGNETIIPLTLPSDAGMWSTFITNLKAQNSNNSISDGTLRGNPNSIQVQQNDPTAITSLAPAQRANAIVPFPRGRFKTIDKGYYADATTTNAYNLDPPRQPLSVSGIKLLDADSTTDALTAASPYGGNFGYNVLVRETDYTSATAWQPGSTLNWVQALFYNPDGPAPFVCTAAGKQLLTEAGVTPSYKVYGTNNTAIPGLTC
jgi:ABC-type phosphate transport system substrate-binding protein